MVEDTTSLDEIVVVGYGTRKKSHLTGAISKIGGDDVAAVQATRVDEALAGKLAGVLIQNASGEPGADPKIQIRAASSVSGSSNPLIVVDGFPISGSLATVNSNDIQSIEILKDAASAAIYGSRGANGVVLVTTKKGKTGKPKFSYNTYTSFSNK
jgi:TonB-dependent SusC/RagA subfamily outer membrane receptor